MSTKELATLLKLTKPKSPEEERKYLEERHGTTVRDNASADLTALDDRARASLAPRAKKARTKTA